MTTQIAPATIAAPTPRERAGYGSLWRTVPRELGFLVLTMPLGILSLSVLSSILSTGVGSIVLVFGFLLILLALWIARGFGTLELVRLRWAGRPAIARPAWPGAATGGFWRRVLSPFGYAHYWLYLLWGMVIAPIIGVISWTLTVTWTAGALGGVTYWIWSRFLPRPDTQFWLHQVVLDFLFPGNTLDIDPMLGENLFELVIGIIFLVTIPFITRGMVLMHDAIARGVLGAFRSEALAVELAEVSASRGAALTAEDHSLRRLERDLHDGPQQRLVRLQYDLAAAERSMDSDPEAARRLLEEARVQASDTLDELRALSRGFAPPLLEDRGLAAGLESLAALSPIPVVVDVHLGDRLAPELERSAYFVAAELLSNAAKHSGATSITLHAGVQPGVLGLQVTDNGHGGAAVQPGHGLAGLTERLAGLRGSLDVSSPVGGPTVVTATIPI